MPTLYQSLCIFLIYAFLGWCVEVVYEASRHGKFINRGFLSGPVCPIYGFGVLIVVTLLTPLKDNLFVLFIGSVLLTSALEFVTGFTLEKLFHDKWWDYSKEPANIMGYVCLRFSLAWGLACVLVIDVIHPPIRLMIERFPARLGTPLLVVLFIILLIDFTLSVLAATKLSKRLTNMDALTKRMRVVSDAVGASLADHTIEWKEKLDEKIAEHKPEIDALHERYNALAKEARISERRLLTAFPRLQNGKFSESALRIQQSAAAKNQNDAAPPARNT